jgi:hypothetical protein
METDFEKFSVMSFYPGCGQDNHPLASITAHDATLNAVEDSGLIFNNDSDADNKHDLADDEDLFEQI